MKVKVSEAAKNQLNWMVSLATGVPVTLSRGVLFWTGTNHVADPITNWSQGGPIIERERISTNSDYNGAYPDPWVAESYSGGVQRAGHTPLIAAMRCFCVSKLGEEVEVPDELA